MFDGLRVVDILALPDGLAVLLVEAEMDDDAVVLNEGVTVTEPVADNVEVTEPVAEILEVTEFDGLMEDEGETLLDEVIDGDVLMETDAVLEAEPVGLELGLNVTDELTDVEMVEVIDGVTETVAEGVTEIDDVMELD